MKSDIKIPVEVYSRVVGYYRPVDQWNRGKQAEFSERKDISVSNIKSALYTAETGSSVRSE